MENKLPEIPLDFATNDYQGYFELMKDAIPIFTPDWTDTSDTDMGIVILQLLSYGLHVLGYNHERIMSENILELARTKKGILMGCRFLGYTPERQSAAVVKLKIKRDSDFLNRENYVPIGAKFSTNTNLGTPIIFETMEILHFPVGEEIGYVNAVQGETIEEESIAVSNGRANQRYTLMHPDVLVETIFLYTMENETIRPWTKVDNLLDSEPTDRHFIADLDEEDRTIVRFGDGIFGMIPPRDIQLFATYRIGGGTIGNLAPGLINNVYETDIDLGFIEEVTNEDFSSGGKNYEDLQQAKQRAPKFYRSREKAITPMDFKDLAELYPGIEKAKVVETYVTTNLYLYLLAEGNIPAGEALCEELKAYIDERRVGNVNLHVLPCKLKNFGIKLKVFVHDKFVEEEVLTEVEQNLKDEFGISKFDFGGEFFAAKVIDVAFNTAGVKNVVLDTDITVDVSSADDEILNLESVVVELGGS